MIDAWTWPAFIGVLFGTLAFFALLVPILIWESRSHGQIRFLRLVGAAMVAVYGVALLAYTLFPVPTPQWCAANPVPGRNPTPFAFVGDLLEYQRANGWRSLLTSFVFLQVAFNVLLFVPWGALLRRYFGRGIAFATLSGLAISAAIELTQTTGALGLLPCRYRVGDVDDIILNTGGAVLGATLSGLLLFFLPDPRVTARTRGRARPVTRTRRLIGMLIDAALFTTIPAVLLTVYRVVLTYVLGAPKPGVGPWDDFAAGAVVFVCMLAVRRGGGSPGQRAVWLEPRWATPPGARLVPRFLLGFGGWALLTLGSLLPGIGAVGEVLGWAASGIAVASVIAVLTDRQARGLSLRASGAELVDSRVSRRT